MKLFYPLALLSLLSFDVYGSKQCLINIPGTLPNVTGERNSGTDYQGSYNSRNAVNNGQTNSFSGGSLTGVVNGVDGTTNISTNYRITKGGDHHGFGSTRYSRNESNKILLVSRENTRINKDVMQYQISLSNTTAGYQSQVTLRQTLNVTRQNNEAANWTFTWTGGGYAVFYDDATPTAYPAGDISAADRLYAHSYPAGFDVNNREIEGLSTTGQFASGGGFKAYMVTNHGTRWRVVFPPGATNIVATKRILSDGRPHSGATVNDFSNRLADGEDSGFPMFGQISPNWLNPPRYYSGEGFNEFLTYQIDFVKGYPCSVPSVSGTALLLLGTLMAILGRRRVRKR